ncbi:hypothetical protein PF005_g2755 [Phytophthora fragariae]|nr:hypothetical protein PF005_g2755 [Phytophthora fragariae]KAE9326553.1 hypothetical protein PF001_g2392 [Phytophthora fragariae]KAE9360129.1 hypothetical protein PF008_g1924 [Phytophthora fragariae]
MFGNFKAFSSHRTDAASTSTVEVLLQLNSVTAAPSLMMFNADTTAMIALLLDIPTTGFRIRGRRLKVH